MLISLSDLLSKTWQIYIANWKTLEKYILSMFLPQFILFVVGAVSLSASQSYPQFQAAFSLIVLALLVAAGVFGFLNYLALMLHSGGLVRGQTTMSWRDSFVAANKFFWPTIWVGLVVGLIVFGGTILFVIPGIIFLVWYSFTSYTIVLDGYAGLGATLQKSKRLVSGRWFSVAIRLFVPALLLAIASAVFHGILGAIFLFLPVSAVFSGGATTLVGGFFGAILSTLAVIAGSVLYVSAVESTPQTTSLPL